MSGTLLLLVSDLLILWKYAIEFSSMNMVIFFKRPQACERKSINILHTCTEVYEHIIVYNEPNVLGWQEYHKNYSTKLEVIVNLSLANTYNVHKE